MAWAMQFPISLVEHSTRQMRADIAIGDQSHDLVG